MLSTAGESTRIVLLFHGSVMIITLGRGEMEGRTEGRKGGRKRATFACGVGGIKLRLSTHFNTHTTMEVVSYSSFPIY